MDIVEKVNSIKKIARFAGLVYLLIAIIAILANSFVLESLIILGDAATTANNIMANELLFRSAIASFMVLVILDVAVAWALYILLKPVNKNLAMLAAWFRVVFATILGIALHNFLSLLNIDPSLWKEAKIEAIKRGITATDLLEMALRKELQLGNGNKLNTEQGDISKHKEFEKDILSIRPNKEIKSQIIPTITEAIQNPMSEALKTQDQISSPISRLEGLGISNTEFMPKVQNQISGASTLGLANAMENLRNQIEGATSGTTFYHQNGAKKDKISPGKTQ